MLARQTEELVTHTVFKQSSKHGLSQTLAICVLWAAMDHPTSDAEAEPHNVWNALLAAMVHCRAGEVLQPLEEMGKVELSCRFARDALCAELYDWDEAEQGSPQPAEGRQTGRVRE